MPTTDQIEQARGQMKKYASMMNDLADYPNYVVKLINNDNLDEFERALRRFSMRRVEPTSAIRPSSMSNAPSRMTPRSEQDNPRRGAGRLGGASPSA